MMMPGKCTGPQYLSENLMKWTETAVRPRFGKNGQAGRASDLVQKILGSCEAENWTKIDELLQAGASRYQKSTAIC